MPCKDFHIIKIDKDGMDIIKKCHFMREELIEKFTDLKIEDIFTTWNDDSNQFPFCFKQEVCDIMIRHHLGMFRNHQGKLDYWMVPKDRIDIIEFFTEKGFTNTIKKMIGISSFERCIENSKDPQKFDEEVRYWESSDWRKIQERKGVINEILN